MSVSTRKMRWPDDFINKVICGDCLEILPQIPDGVIDAVITDPPYNVSGKRGVVCKDKNHKSMREDWDVDFQVQALEGFRCNNILVFCSYHLLKDYLNWKKPRQILHWHKNNAFPALSQFYDFSVEYILWYCDNLKYFNKKAAGRDLMITPICGGNERTSHPTQKPLKVLRHLINVHTQENDLIIDPYAGSGTTLVAAKQLGRRYIGIEISPDYCKIAEDRLRQGELF